MVQYRNHRVSIAPVIWILVFMLITDLCAISQLAGQSCGTVPPAAPILLEILSPDNYKKDGVSLTSHGDLKVMMVLIEFKDDPFEPQNPFWPSAQPGADLPYLMRPENERFLFLPPHSPFIPQPNSITDYFHQMSRNSPTPLNVYGKVFRHVLPYTHLEASQDPVHKSMSEAIRSALLAIDDQVGVGLKMFDIWKRLGDYTHAPISDDKIDLVIVAFRNTYREVDPNALAGLNAGGWNAPSNADFLVLGNTLVLPKSGLRVTATYNGGCGIMINNFLRAGGNHLGPTRSTGIYEDWFRLIIHEMSHLLVSPIHVY